MSELDVSLLARHTRLLLHFYPKAYRAHRGEEILDTLLETTRPGQGWPPPREVASVIGGGLRARQAANLNQGLRASLRHVGILATAMLMEQILMVEGLLALETHQSGWGRFPPSDDAGVILGSVLAVLALAAAWSGRRWLVAAVVSAVAATAAFCSFAVYLARGAGRAREAEGVMGAIGAGRAVEQMWLLLALPAVLALAVLLPLAKRAERPPVSLLWLPCVALAVDLVAGLTATSWPSIDHLLPVSAFRAETLLYPYDTYLSLVPVLVAVCWLATDVRPLAAVALQFLLIRVILIAVDGYPGQSRSQLAIVGGLLLLALTGALVWLLRHRARTAPPTIG